MKKIIIIALVLASCSNKSSQVAVYKDSAVYYSNRMAAIADAGYSHDEATRIKEKTDYVICSTMRKYYIDKIQELSK